MAIEINIASCECAGCNKPLAATSSFWDAPSFRFGGSWGYFCASCVEDYVSPLGKDIGSYWTVKLSDCFAVGVRTTDPRKAL